MFNFKGKIKILRDMALNFISNGRYDLSYIVEVANWSIKYDGKYITVNLNKLNLLKSRITTTYLGIRNQIIHFGSVHTFLREKGFCQPHRSNKLVLTWFHFVPQDKKNKNIIEAQKYLEVIHTSCNITKNNLVNFGVDPKKIVVIPLGVDLSLFSPVSFKEKQKIKKQLGIPSDRIVIGSFQKDGVGWGEGLEPKLIKGPDIFVKVVEKLAKEYPIFVLLVGPARGYVKKEIEKRNIPYKHVGYLENLKKVAFYYQVLDLYLITSRIEGGPKQILESWASGIPVVSTKVGMIPDIAKDGEDILLAEVENVTQLVENCQKIIEDCQLRERLSRNELEKVKDFSWEKIAQRYYQEIYSKLV